MVLKTSQVGELTRIQLTAKLLGRPIYQVSAYLLGDTLIDSGCPRTAPELVAWLRGRPLSRVVHTHHHEDHTGGDAALIRAFGVQVEAPSLSVPILKSYYRLPLYRKLVWGQPESVSATPLGKEVEIGEYRFQVIPTPGHCADHVCLFQEDEGWLFTGDLYIAPRVLYLRRAEDACEELRSLRRLIALRPRTLIGSHAGIIPNGAAALERRARYWENLAAKAQELRRQGVAVGSIRRRLLGRQGFMNVVSGGSFSKTNLVRSLLGCPNVLSS